MSTSNTGFKRKFGHASGSSCTWSLMEGATYKHKGRREVSLEMGGTQGFCEEFKGMASWLVKDRTTWPFIHMLYPQAHRQGLVVVSAQKYLLNRWMGG